MNALGVLALELAGGEIPARRCSALNRPVNWPNASAVTWPSWCHRCPSWTWCSPPRISTLEVLRPGWPIHRRLEELQMRAPGRNQGPRLLAFGTDAEGDVPLPFQADATLVGGGLRVVPFLLTGNDVATTSAVADALEETLLANGMAHADTALMAQNTFGARIEHARYFTVNDLAAMMSMQYDNQGLAALWPLIETAIMAPGEDEWLNAAPEPLLRYTHGEARMALFDPVGWCAHYSHSKNDCDRLKGIYEQFLMRQRQMAAVLEAHGVPVLFVHCEAGQDARELLAR